MKHSAFVITLAVAATANPLPQSIDAAAVKASPTPSAVIVPYGGGTDRSSYDSSAVNAATYDDVFAHPGISKRSLERRTQVPACGQNPAGSGPSPSTDTDTAFLSYSGFSSAAQQATLPDGYVSAFTNLQATTSMSMGYLGFDTLSSYDTEACATNCNMLDGCVAFNIYFERDPILNPAPNCPNPASTTNIKCSYWGAPVGPESATNYGQYHDDFHIVQAGSNGYNAVSVDNVDGYTGTYLSNNAINAPSSCQTYITSKFWADGQPFDPNRCAAACQAETDYNAQYLNSRAVCRFFNTYVLNKNGVPQGQYCALYTASWDASYATNSGYNSGSDVFTNSYSYSYSNTTDPQSNNCNCGIGSSCNTGMTTTSSTSTTTASSTTTTTTVPTPTTVPTTTIITTTTAISPPTTTPTTTTTTTTTKPSTTTTPSTTSASSTTTTSKATTTSSTTTTSASISTTTKSSTTSTCTTLTTSTKTSSTTSSSTSTTTATKSPTPTPKGPCFRVKIKGPSYCNNKYVGLDGNGQLSWSGNPGTTFYLDSSVLRTKDGKYGKCPDAKTSKNHGSITFGTATDPAAITCSTKSGDISCSVAGTTITSLWTSPSQGGVMMGKPTSGQWDKVGVKVETCSCSA